VVEFQFSLVVNIMKTFVANDLELQFI
jgi:hypothetical protein